MTKRFDERKKITPSYSGAYFSLLVFCSLVISVVFSVIVKYCGLKSGDYAYTILLYLLNPLSTIILTIVFLTCLKLDAKQSVRLKNARIEYYLLAVLVLFGCYAGLSGVNGYFNEFIKRVSGKDPQIPQILEFSPLNYCITVLTICVIPAIAEEVAFRGMTLGGLDEYNPIVASLVTGFAFSLFHMNPAQTPYQFVTGFAFSLLTVCSGSIYPTITVHFLNNFITINLYYFGSGFTLPQIASGLLTAAGVIAFVAFVVIAVFDCKRKGGNNDKKSILSWVKFALPGIAACVAVWVFGLL